jgi:hypothetical protein
VSLIAVSVTTDDFTTAPVEDWVVSDRTIMPEDDLEESQRVGGQDAPRIQSPQVLGTSYTFLTPITLTLSVIINNIKPFLLKILSV